MTEQEYDKEQLRIMRNAFKAFDHDERGYIEHSDVAAILEILGQKLDEKAVKALISEVDKGNSGKMDFSQFCRLAARFIEVEEDAGALASELKEAFRVYDKEGKGYLTVQVLRDILHELDDKISSTDLDLIIEEIDADGSGTVDFDEFMQVMTGKNFSNVLFHRRFVFESLPHVSNSQSRLRLHRRIECHFERFFEHLRKPFDAAMRYQNAVTKANKPVFACSTKPFPTVKCKCQTPKASSDGTCYKSTVVEKNPNSRVFINISKCGCRPPFRPRFPKWVPVLVLYREFFQNTRRGCKPRYMLTHN